MMIKIICLTVFIMQWGEVYCYSADQADAIEEVFVVKHCLNRDVANTHRWPGRYPFQMTTYSHTYPIIKTTWLFHRVTDNGILRMKCKTRPPCERGNNFVVEPFSLDEGKYKITAIISVHGVVKKRKECFLNIRVTGPVAIIARGSTLRRRINESVVVDGSQSRDYGAAKGADSLKFRWTCTNLKTDFCKGKVGTDKTFLIPGNFSVDQEQFNVKLKVISANTLISTAEQIIYIKARYAHFTLTCLDNCPPLKLGQAVMPTYQATCEKYCPKDCAYIWNLNVEPILLKECFGSDICKLPATLAQNATIIFGCKVKIKEADIIVTFASPWEKTVTCTLQPQTGTSFITTFKLNCDSSGYVDHIDVYVKDESSQEEFLISWIQPFKKKFRLKPNAQAVLVRVYERGEYDTISIDVKVKSVFTGDSAKSINKQLADLYFGQTNESITSSIKENNINAALSKINSIWDNIESVKGAVTSDKDYQLFIHNLKLFVIRDLTKMPIETYAALSSVSSAVDKMLSYQTPKKSIPLLARDVTILCKKIGYFQLDFLNENPFPEEVAEQTKKISDTLVECGNKNSNPNHDQMKPLPNLPISDKAPQGQSAEDTIVENYPSYADYDNDFYENMEKFEETSSNIIKTAFLAGSAIAQTIQPNTTQLIANKTDVGQLVHRYGKSKAAVEHIVSGVRVIPSKDIYEGSDIFLSLMTWRKNIFWWSGSKVQPMTYVAAISFVDKTTNNKVSKFKNPHTIIFDIIRPPKVEVKKITQNITVDDYVNPYINIHRINLMKHQALLVEFFDMKKGEKFNVVVKNFEVPTIQDFKGNVDVFDKENPFKSYRNDNNHAAWFYVAIFPAWEMLTNVRNDSATFTYTVSFAASVCYRWNFVEGWARSCKGGDMTTKNKISCECSHLSSVAADIEPVIEKFLVQDDTLFETTLQECYFIFFIVLIMFLLFCILTLFGEKENGIYYASDNQYKNRYAYLLMVRTGKYYATTVKAAIKINGDQLVSEPHVLNFPDPDYKILQRGNEDWIVITTHKCLGNLTSIELWHDSSGIKQSWHCKDIVIFDLQTRREWFFNINQTLSVLHNHSIEVTPTRVVKSKFKRALELTTERHSWNLFEDDIHRTTTYFSRLLLVYSKLATLLLIVVLFYGLPSMQPMDSYDRYIGFQFDLFLCTVVFVGSLISFMVHFVVLCGAKKLTMYFLALMSITSNTILIVFGFWIPYYASLRIITAWLFGALVDIFVYEMILKALKKIIYGPKKIASVVDEHFSRVRNEIEWQREFLNEKYPHLERIREMSLYKPLTRKRVKAKRLRVLRRRALGQQIEDLIMFGIYVILLYCVVLIGRDSNVFLNRNTVADLVEGKFTRTNLFSHIKSIPDIYDYINNSLIAGMQLDHWYTNFHLEDPGMMADFNNKYIGVARLRQSRVKKDSCDAHKSASFLSEKVSCYPKFVSPYEEHRSFEDDWNHPTYYVMFRKRLYKMWVYSFDDSTGSNSYTGEFATYPGGGYVVPLGRNKYNSLDNFYTIKNSTWIDRCTRSVFIEFLTYNANYNMFNSVLLIIEIGETGMFNVKSEVFPVRMTFVQSEIEKSSAALFIIFVVWVGILSINRTTFMWSEGIISLKQFWNILDMNIILLSVVAIIIYFVRYQRIKELLDILEKVKHNEFVNYVYLFNTHYALTIIGAILVCASTIRLWKLLRFFKRFLIFEKTLVLAAAAVFALILCHSIITFVFTWVAHFLYAEQSTNFLTMKKALDTIVTIFMRDFHAYEYEIFRSFGFVFIAVYSFLMYTIYQVYIVIVMIAYQDAQMFYSEYQESYSIFDYIKDEFEFMFQLYKRKAKRLRGGDEIRQTILPKANQFLYANCVTTTSNAINSMKFVAVVVLRNLLETEEQKKELTAQEITLMLRVCHHFLIARARGDNMEIFYKTHFAGEKFKIVDSRRIDRARRAVEIILRDPEKVVEKRENLKSAAVLDRNLKKLDETQRKLDICLKALQNIVID